MTTIEDQVRDAAPSPRSSPDVEEIWRRGSRQRLVDRALLGTAGVACVALIVVAATALTAEPQPGGPIIAEPPVSTPAGPPSFDAAPPAVAPADPLPAGWQRVEVGDARFGLPPDVAVIVQQPGDEARCTNAIGEDTAFVAPDGLPAAEVAGEVVCRLVRPASVAVTAVPLSSLDRLDPPIDATPLRVNGVVGSNLPPVPAGVDTRTYRFPSLDLQLTFAFLDNRPDLDEEVLATLAHADDSRPIVVDVPITATVVQQPAPFTVVLGEVLASPDRGWVQELTITNAGDEPLELQGPAIAVRMTDGEDGLLFATDPDCYADFPRAELGCDTIIREELLGPGESLARTITLVGPTTGVPAGTYTGDVRLRFRGSAGVDGAGSTDDTADARESTVRLRYEVGQDLSIAPPSPISRLDVEVEEDIEPFEVTVTDPATTVDGWTYEVSITNVGDRTYLISDERWAQQLEDGGDVLFTAGHGCSVEEVSTDRRDVICTDELRLPTLAPGETFTDTVTATGELTPPGARFWLTKTLRWWDLPDRSEADLVADEPPTGTGEVVLVHMVGSPDLQVLQGDPAQEPPPKCAPPYVPIEVMPLEVIIPDEFRVQVVVGDEVRVDQLAIVYEAEDGTEVRRQVAAGDLPSGTHEVSVPLDFRDGDGRPLAPGQAYQRRAEIDYTQVATTGTGPCEQTAGGSGQLGTTLDTFGFQE